MVLKRDSLYSMVICGLGILLFLLHFSWPISELSQWVQIYTLVGAVLLLNHFSITLPLSGKISMDSAIYLACIFLFGLDIPLTMLMFSSFIYYFINIKLTWWKHFFNFANYSLMIISTSYLFTLTGGEIGKLDFSNLWPYTTSLTVYFFLNVLIMWLYFLLASKQPMALAMKSTFRKDALKEAFTSYLSTLVLSLVLSILIDEYPIFGLFLFIVLSVILSLSFKKFLNLYKYEEEKAKKDFLTGLYNHGFFKLKLDEMIKNQAPFCVALIDLDDFKKYNDSNGHIQGDELLKFFGQFMKEKTKQSSILCARYGGEEFGLIIPNTSKREASTYLNKIRKEYNDTHFIGVEFLPLACLSFSSGIAEFEKGTYGSSELLAKADKALYYAKSQGKNNIQIYQDENIYQDDFHTFQDMDALEQQLQIFLSKDVYTYQHSKRVFHYAVDFSENLQLTAEEKRTLILGALIHDIGKIEIPRDVINKKSRLEDHEWELMQKHVTYGKEIIASTKKYDELIPLVELHHEHFNGMGYPYGLKGDNIPKLARILCIIDSFDAMTTERPYKKTKSFLEGFNELRKYAGQQFDPAFVEPFIEMIQAKYSDKLASGK